MHDTLSLEAETATTSSWFDRKLTLWQHRSAFQHRSFGIQKTIVVSKILGNVCERGLTI